MTTAKRLRAVKDRRSTWARRHRELAAAFAADLGSGLSAADRALTDHAATVALECEALKIRQLNGEPVDLDDLVRLTNSLTRIRIELGKRAKAADDGPDWGELQAEADRIAEERRSAANGND
jgi:hypothetical protein